MSKIYIYRVIRSIEKPFEVTVERFIKDEPDHERIAKVLMELATALGSTPLGVEVITKTTLLSAQDGEES